MAVEPLEGNGTIITIGERPRLGDLNKGDDLPVYKRVGAALSILHDGEYIGNRTALSGFNKYRRQEGKDWVNRFFK